MNEVGFELQKAHKHFSAFCFNQAWDLMDKTARTADEDEEMLRLSLASTWHWASRDDCEPSNLSVGFWQTSRIHAILGRPEEAKRYALRALESAQPEGTDPFYLAYAYEALARAEALAGHEEEMEQALALAHRTAERIEDPDSQGILLDDLASIEPA